MRDDEIYRYIKVFMWKIKFLSVKRLKNSLLKKEEEIQEKEAEIQIYKKNLCTKEELIRELNDRNKNLSETLEIKKGEFLKQRQEDEIQIEELRKSNRKLEATISALERKILEKSMFNKDQWCTGWIEHWKRYFVKNYNNFSDKVERIKRGVDEKSQYIIDLLLERNIELFSIQKYTNYFLYNYDRVYESWELEGMKEQLPAEEIWKKYHIKEGTYLEIPVFKFHCGLLFLPKEVLERIKGKDIIDGGAFWGDSAIVFQEYMPGSIHAFEPMQANFQDLCGIKEDNKFENLYLNNTGLGEKEEIRMIYYHEMLSGASVINYKALSWENEKENTKKVKITTIDNYVEKNNLDVAVIKLDIEGNELEAIKGALKTILKYKPILLISVYHLPKDLFEIKPLIESLNLGYEFMFRKLVFHDPLTEVSLIGYVPETEE